MGSVRVTQRYLFVSRQLFSRFYISRVNRVNVNVALRVS